MANDGGLKKPSPSELRELDERLCRVLAVMAAVPEGEREKLSSAKFDGPIAETILDPLTGEPVQP